MDGIVGGSPYLLARLLFEGPAGTGFKWLLISRKEALLQMHSLQ